ncbi:MAG TPA: O-antigen ligase family protein [Candidatus Polarisedimenticolia bacterium]|jgi:O-antigen ligase|nr:O-antigen ligase family protein [Candidatus Polarisedimenticolia bacterium]
MKHAGRLERTLDTLIRGGLLVIVAVAPLPFGSVEPWAYSPLELSVALVGLLFMYRLFLFPGTRVHFASLLLAPLGFLLLMGFQLVPLPPAALRAISPGTAGFYGKTLPGYAATTRDIAATDAAVLGQAPVAPVAWRPISQVPSATRTYLLKGIAFTVFLFLLINQFRTARQVRVLLYVFVGMGTFEAFYGLLEYLSGHQHIFTYQKRYYLEAATGTFINRNHFAAFLEMSLLVALGLLFSRLRTPAMTETWRERLLGLTDRRASLNLTLILCIAILVIGLVLSYSRAGIILGLGSAVLFCLLQFRQGWSLRKTLLIALLAVAVLIPAYGVGYWTLTGRYSVLTTEFSAPGGRLAVWRKTLEIVRDFPVLGTGVGTFQHVFPRYREATTTAFYDYTHNDYLQVLSESGLAGGALLALGIACVARLWWRSARGRVAGQVLLTACGLGLSAVALHELFDFGLQIPANLLALAFLAGCLTLLAAPALRAEGEGTHG